MQETTRRLEIKAGSDPESPSGQARELVLYPEGNQEPLKDFDMTGQIYLRSILCDRVQGPRGHPNNSP